MKIDKVSTRARIFFFLLVISTISYQCKSQVNWSPGMEIISYNGGGMVPESKTITIKDSMGSCIHWRQPKTDTVLFILSRQELVDLLKEINAVHFTDMVSGNTGGIAYDKPTTSVELKWEGKIHKVSVGAVENIISGKATDFNKLYTYIGDLVKKKTGMQHD